MAFFGKLYAFRNHIGVSDCMRWTPSKQHIFEVRSFFRKLSSLGTTSFSWRSIWKVKVPLRVSFFVWTATLGKIFTKDNLRNRGIICGGLVLYMQATWRVCKPSSPSL